ncbi:Hypothetical protein CINCED_3A015082 [Cinara cedri]|uniref:Uncharacterized protein n=1 Tax=Cinara cedri TaxID=506608 RepID=A0A5E4MP42_9HEMI|nr:Hypothetical protein CINCED_3A015082 [Cinara cedri]
MDTPNSLALFTNLANGRFLYDTLDLATSTYWAKARNNLNHSNGGRPLFSIPRHASRDMHSAIHDDREAKSLLPPADNPQELSGTMDFDDSYTDTSPKPSKQSLSRWKRFRAIIRNCFRRVFDCGNRQ